jgi:hypothetical protein
MKRKTMKHRKILILAVFVLLLVAVPASLAFAAAVGPNDAGTGEDVTGVGTIAWTNPGNITTAGTPYAYAFLNSGESTHYLRGTGYGFALPSGSTINGITVQINRASYIQTARDSIVRLVKAGAVAGDNKALTGTDWPFNSFGTQAYGGASDLWGTTWTADDINNANFGVVLSATNPNTISLIAIDYLRITVDYTLPGTSTAVDCGSGDPTVTYGDSLTCEVTVTASAGSNTPSGTVSWATNGSGAFTTSPCTLSGSGGTATCSVSYTPSAVGTGTHQITATYGGDANFTGSNGDQDVTVNQATPTLSVTNSPVTYNGSPQAADVTGSVAGTVSNVQYDGSSTEPADAGTYAVTADFTPDNANYASLADASAGDFIIDKATPTLSVMNSPVTYDGTPQAADVVGSVAGTVSNVLYAGFSTEPTDAGTYAVTADFAPTDSTNYESLTGASAGDFVIEKATPTLSVTNSPVTYNGSPQAADVSGSVAGTVSNVLYDGSSTEPTDAGTYAVTANFVPDETTNYESLIGASAGDFVIDQVTPTLSVTNSPVTYDGSPQAADVVGSVLGTVSNVQYDGSATEPTDAGTYAVTANFTPTDTTNYASLTGASAGDFVINQIATSLSVTNSPVTYDGNPQAADVSGSVAGTVSNVQYDGSGTVPTDAGTYAVTANFVPDDANYASLTDASAGNFVIEKATPTLSVTNSPVTYDGSPQAADVSSSIAGTVSNVQYDGSGTEPTDAGTYAVTADFTPDDTTNYASLTGAPAGDFVINQIATSLSVTNSPVTYDGTPQAADVSGSVAGTVSNVLYDGSGTVPTDAGTYAVTADFVPDDAVNYESLTGAAAGDFVINHATPTISVANSPAPYTGSPQAAEVVGSVPGTASNVKYDGSDTMPMDVGTYAVTADFTPDDTTNYESLTDAPAGDFVITVATPTLSVTNSPVTYDGTPQAAEVVGSVAGTVSNVKYDGSDTVPTDVGTYAVTADFTPDDMTNYESLVDAPAGDFVIEMVATSLSVTNSPVTYTGLPQAAEVVGSVPGTVSNVKYDGSDTVPTSPGVYVVTADFTPDDTVNYESLVDAPAGDFVILGIRIYLPVIRQFEVIP